MKAETHPAVFEFSDRIKNKKELLDNNVFLRYKYISLLSNEY